MTMAFLSPSPLELMVIAVIALIVLGPSRLPEAARSVGKGMREMRNSFQLRADDDDHARSDELDDPDDEPAAPDDESTGPDDESAGQDSIGATKSA